LDGWGFQLARMNEEENGGRGPGPPPPARSWLGSRGDALRGLGLPEDLRDLVDRIQELLALRRVLGLLRLSGELGGVPEQVVQVGVLLEVVRLAVVRPQDPEVLLDQDGGFFLTGD